MTATVIWDTRLKPGAEAEGLRLTRRIWSDMRAFEGYLSHEIFIDQDAPGHLIVLGRWRSREDADRVPPAGPLDHRGGPAGRLTRAALPRTPAPLASTPPPAHSSEGVVRPRSPCWEDPMQIALTDREVEILHGLLSDYLPYLKREVARTEQHELRHLLVERQELVERMLAQVMPVTS